MKTRLLVLATIVLVLAGLAYLLWGFWLGFIGLSIVYTAAALCIIYVISWYYHEEWRNDAFVSYIRNNNTWFYVGCGICAVTFVIACFNFGPAILLPENHPSPETRGAVSNFLDHLWEGKDAPAKVVIPTEPLPWATGTWFWWKAFGLYVLITIGYFPFAFWDEFWHACHGVRELAHKLWDEHKAKRNVATPPAAPATPPAAPTATSTAPGATASATATTNGGGQKFTFGEFLRWDLLVELSIEFIKLFMEKRRA